MRRGRLRQLCPARDAARTPIESGTDAILTLGTTGKSATMTDEENNEVVKLVVEHAAGHVPAIAGSGPTARHAGAQEPHVLKLNADAPLIISPYCNKSNEEDIYQCLVHTASAVDIPCIIYNIPGRTAAASARPTWSVWPPTPTSCACSRGQGATVATGAVCVEDVPAGAVVTGVSAKVIKQANESPRTRPSSTRLQPVSEAPRPPCCRQPGPCAIRAQDGSGRRMRPDPLFACFAGGVAVATRFTGLLFLFAQPFAKAMLDSLSSPFVTVTASEWPNFSRRVVSAVPSR
ncbi:MAG: dihydrodipicolinate synthase family protein [Collinsella sp.]